MLFELQELVSPTFFSYVVLATPKAASRFLTRLARKSISEEETILGWVRVASIDGSSDSTTTWERNRGEHPSTTLLRTLPSLLHLNLTYSDINTPTSISTLISLAVQDLPLLGVTGIVLQAGNLNAVVLAINKLAPNLLQLSLFQSSPALPTSLDNPQAAHHIHLPNLVNLGIGIVAPPQVNWLEGLVGDLWTLPKLSKLALGSPPGSVF